MASSPRVSQPALKLVANTTQFLVQHAMVINKTRGQQFIHLSDAGYIFIGCTLSVTWSFGSFLNGLCLYMFARYRRLRSPTNIFIMSLNLCDFLMCFVGTPVALSSAWSRRWIWGDTVCDLEAFTVYFLGMSSMYIIMAIAFDRYIAITKPLLGSKITKDAAYISCALCYFFGFLWAILPAFGWNEFDQEGAGISCSVVWETDDPVHQSYIWVIFFFCLVIPLGVILYSFWGVIVTLRTLNKNSVWDMNSRVAKKYLTIEKRILKTAIFIVLSFFGCWMPYVVVSFITAFFGSHLIHPFFATIPPVIAKCQGLFNPIIYVITNKRMREALIELLPCHSLRESLLKKGKETVEERESEESDIEGGPSKNREKKAEKGPKKKEVDDGKEKKGGVKRNQVQPGEASDKMAVRNEQVPSIRVRKPDPEPHVLFTKRQVGPSHEA